MSTGGLLFIPDISGFSQFVEKTEIEHCQFIIQKLLEVLINSNQLQLQVSEIEGDAILFYRFGSPPDVKEIYDQVEKMFCDFHHVLRSMSVRRLCQCGACKEAEHLSLKIITHQGEFTTYNIKEFSKLIGKDVIRAHQLLKNDIPQHEYWLVTDNLYSETFKAEQLPGWMQWMPGSKETENDSIRFQYAYLSPLLDTLPQESRFPSARQQGKIPLLTVEQEIDADFMDLFYLAINLDLRPQWVPDIKRVDKMGHPSNIIGATHRCVLEQGSREFITTYIDATETCIEYEETTANQQQTVHYEFHKTDRNSTHALISMYTTPNSVKQLLFNLFMKKKMTHYASSMLNNLAQLNVHRKMSNQPAHQHHHETADHHHN
jgi:hypothetical protein